MDWLLFDGISGDGLYLLAFFFVLIVAAAIVIVCGIASAVVLIILIRKKKQTMREEAAAAEEAAKGAGFDSMADLNGTVISLGELGKMGDITYRYYL